MGKVKVEMAIIFSQKRFLTSACILVPALLAFIASPGAGAQELVPEKKAQAQLLVVLIYDASCTVSCSVVKPIVRDLTTTQQIQYEEFNTSPNELKDALAKARKFKLETFVSDRTEEVPVVGIFTSKGKRLKELSGRKTKEVYKEAIEKALEKVKS
jgi:hypothetical protein